METSDYMCYFPSGLEYVVLSYNCMTLLVCNRAHQITLTVYQLEADSDTARARP